MFLILDKEMDALLKTAYDAGVTAALYDEGYDIGAREKAIAPMIEQLKSRTVVIDVKVPAKRNKKS